MLSDFQQQEAWERWLAAETRSQYFARIADKYAFPQRLIEKWPDWLTPAGAMADKYAFLQRLISWAALVFSSGALVSILAGSHFPASLFWIKPMIPFIVAALILASLIQQYSKRSYECSELHFKWNRIAAEYETLWGKTYASDAEEKLEKLKERSAELSRSGLDIPENKSALAECQEQVIRLHSPRNLAA